MIIRKHMRFVQVRVNLTRSLSPCLDAIVSVNRGLLFRISILMINQVFAKSNVQNRLW